MTEEDGPVYWVVKIRETEYLKKSDDERYMSPGAPTTSLRSEAAKFDLRRAKTVAHFHKNGDNGRANGRAIRVSRKSDQTRVCLKCDKEKSLHGDFRKSPRSKLGRATHCRSCQNDYSAEWRKRNPKKYRDSKGPLDPRDRMIWAASTRARNLRVSFALSREDIVIPPTCPALGIPLIGRHDGGGVSDNSPTLDRIVQELGYIPENVCVISHRANRIKTDARLNELERVTSYVEREMTRMGLL